MFNEITEVIFPGNDATNFTGHFNKQVRTITNVPSALATSTYLKYNEVYRLKKMMFYKNVARAV
jgi:hypothetical protein